ncbi:hypothetical protein D2W49_25765, partial [Burkholderia pseudomallei]
MPKGNSCLSPCRYTRRCLKPKNDRRPVNYVEETHPDHGCRGAERRGVAAGLRRRHEQRARRRARRRGRCGGRRRRGRQHGGGDR